MAFQTATTIMLLTAILPFVACLSHGSFPSRVRPSIDVNEEITQRHITTDKSVPPVRRDVLGVLASALFLPLLPTAATAVVDTEGPAVFTTVRLTLESRRAGLELYETALGSRPIVAVRRVLPGGAVAAASPPVQPGMILLDFTTAESVMDALQKGPYPLDLRFVNLAAGGDAIGDDGKPMLSAADALRVSRQSNEVSDDGQEVRKGLVARVARESKGICGVKSRRLDVMEILYDARIGGPDGPVYDSSAQRGTGLPYQFVMGSGDMLQGVDLGLYDMCPGEVRELDIPPVLAYGGRGNKMYRIPSDSRLYWTVKLVAVNSVREDDKRTRDEIEERGW